MPKVSVIMCAYNSEKTIGRAVDCLLSQTLQDIEIILVNDGSSDRTFSIIQSYAQKDMRIRIITHDNMGNGLSRNTAIEIASGDYLAFVDSDDTIEDNALELMYEKTENGLYDIVACNHNRIYPDKVRRNVRETPDRIFRISEYGRKKYIEQYMFSYIHEMGVFNKLIRRSLMTDNGILFSSNREMLFDDVIPALQLACVAKTVVSYNRSFYNYFIYGDSVSAMRSTAERMPYTMPLIVEAFRKWIAEKGLYGELGELLPEYYYSQVYCGIIRVKRFGHADITGTNEILAGFPHYEEYMREIGKFSVRKRFVTRIASKLRLNKSLPIIGLCWLTLIQGKLISREVLRKNYTKADRLM